MKRYKITFKQLMGGFDSCVIEADYIKHAIDVAEDKYCYETITKIELLENQTM